MSNPDDLITLNLSEYRDLKARAKNAEVRLARIAELLIPPYSKPDLEEALRLARGKK